MPSLKAKSEAHETAKNGPAMTFDEIAEKTGMTRQNVFRIFRDAMRKLSTGKNLTEMKKIRDTARGKNGL